MQTTGQQQVDYIPLDRISGVRFVNGYLAIFRMFAPTIDVIDEQVQKEVLETLEGNFDIVGSVVEIAQNDTGPEVDELLGEKSNETNTVTDTEGLGNTGDSF